MEQRGITPNVLPKCMLIDADNLNVISISFLGFFKGLVHNYQKWIIIHHFWVNDIFGQNVVVLYVYL